MILIFDRPKTLKIIIYRNQLRLQIEFTSNLSKHIIFVLSNHKYLTGLLILLFYSIPHLHQN